MPGDSDYPSGQDQSRQVSANPAFLSINIDNNSKDHCLLFKHENRSFWVVSLARRQVVNLTVFCRHSRLRPTKSEAKAA
jgi:hypothetical protein